MTKLYGGPGRDETAVNLSSFQTLSDRESGLEIERRSIATYIHRITSLVRSYAHLTLKKHAPDPLNASALCAEFRHKHSVPMLCPSIGNVLATPLSAPGSVLIKTTLLNSLRRRCSQHPDLALIKTNTDDCRWQTARSSDDRISWSLYTSGKAYGNLQGRSQLF